MTGLCACCEYYTIYYLHAFRCLYVNKVTNITHTHTHTYAHIHTHVRTHTHTHTNTTHSGHHLYLFVHFSRGKQSQTHRCIDINFKRELGGGQGEGFKDY